MEFSQRLQERRQALGMTQQQVADKLGVNVTTYAHYESGRRMPNIERLTMLCSMFDIVLNDHFPIMRRFDCPPELLDALKQTKEWVSEQLERLEKEWKNLTPHDILWRAHDLIARLDQALTPVQKVWEQTMDAPEMDLEGLPSGTTVMQVQYDPEDWALIAESTRLMSRLIDFVFTHKK